MVVESKASWHIADRSLMIDGHARLGCTLSHQLVDAGLDLVISG